MDRLFFFTCFLLVLVIVIRTAFSPTLPTPTGDAIIIAGALVAMGLIFRNWRGGEGR